MHLIPAVADSSAVDAIKSVSYFLTRTGGNVKSENLDWTCVTFANAIMLYEKKKKNIAFVLMFAFCQNISQAVYLDCTVKP